MLTMAVEVSGVEKSIAKDDRPKGSVVHDDVTSWISILAALTSGVSIYRQKRSAERLWTNCTIKEVGKVSAFVITICISMTVY